MEPDEALDCELVTALRPVELPAGFKERVLARAAAGEGPREVLPGNLGQPESPRGSLLSWPQQRRWWSGAAAAALVMGLLGGGLLHEHNRAEDQAQAAKQAQATAQFATAERITAQAMEQMRQQMLDKGVQLDQ